jgi:hypothetical protein
VIAAFACQVSDIYQWCPTQIIWLFRTVEEPNGFGLNAIDVQMSITVETKNMTIKQLVYTSAVTAAVVAGSLAIDATSANAARIYIDYLGTEYTNSTPQLDGDAPPDLVTTIGSNLSFGLYLDTTGLTQNVGSIDYNFRWDRNELALLASSVGLPPVPPPANVSRSFTGLNIATGTQYLLETLTFTVTNGLKNAQAPLNGADLLFDLNRLRGLPGSNPNGPNLLNQVANADRTARVDVQPVPTPALLPGLAAFGLGLLRKRKVETAESDA